MDNLEGQLIEMDVENSKEVSFYLQRFMDEHGKPPNVIVVNPKAPDFTLPEKFEGLGVQIIRRQYIHHPHIVVVGIMSRQ